MALEERVPAESKLNATAQIVAAYLKSGENSNRPSQDEVCNLVKAVYHTIEETLPQPPERRVGLG